MLTRFEHEDWALAMRECAQNPLYHAEGDVWTHTCLVVQALLDDPAYAQLKATDQEVLFQAALWHDVGKPGTTVVEPDGTRTSRGHALRGALLARRWLWAAGWQPDRREIVCALIRYHMVPFFLVDEQEWQRRLLLMGLSLPLEWLKMLARADARGRICADQDRLLQQVELFGELAREHGSVQFADAHSRLTYFRRGGDPRRQVHDDCRCRVVTLSGLPASGKDTWIEKHVGDWPRVSLDELRDELGVNAKEVQSRVVEAARLRAREHLRAGRDFVWNATNLNRQMRSRCLDLFYNYKASVRLVYLEAGAEELESRNAARPRPVPAAALERMLRRWEPPDRSEAQQVEYHW